MNSSLKTILGSHHEYLTLDRNLLIREISFAAYNYADSGKDLSLGRDVRLAFPELTGIEYILIDILEGRRLSFELEGIGRTSDIDQEDLYFYFDLYISRYQEFDENRLIIFFEDATERMALQQALAQRANEACLLVNSLTRSQNYIDRIIRSIADILIVTTASGGIKIVNKYSTDLFGYSQEELINSPISTIVMNEDFLQQVNYLSPRVPDQTLNNIEVSCRTKIGKIITVAFSCSAIETEIKGGKNLIYIGRKIGDVKEDIAERKLGEVNLNNARKGEKRYLDKESISISTIDSELRMPLTSILDSIKLLEQNSQNLSEAEKNEQYHQIKSTINQITEVLNDWRKISNND